MRFRYELALVLLIGLLGIAPSLRPEHVVGDGVDLYGTIWFYWWIEDCIRAWRDPGFTDLFFYPLGKDIFAHTGNNFVDAVIAAPFAWVLGSPTYQRWYVLAMILANALSFRVLAKGRLKSAWAVTLATVAWSVNPYVLFEITCGRLTQAFLPFLPLALHHFLSCEEGGEGRLKPWHHALLAGLYTALQAWTYWFMGWFMVFAMLPLSLYALARSQRRRALLLDYLLAGAACLVVVGPALYAMSQLAADGVVPGLAQDLPKDLFSLPRDLNNNVDTTLHGLVIAEQEGPPMLLSFAWLPLLFAWFAFSRERLRWLPPFFLVLALSLGPVWYTPWTPDQVVLPYYMAAYHYLPFFDRLWFPYRMLSVLFLLACLGVGLSVDRLLAWRPTAWRALPVLLLGFLVGTLAEQHHWRIWPFVTRDLSIPGPIALVEQQPGAIIHLPFGVSQPSIMWQTFHHQPIFGGMGENAPLLWPPDFKSRLRNGFVRALLEATRKPDEERRYSARQRELFEEEGFRWVVLHRDLVESEAGKWTRGFMTDAERAGFALDATRRLVGLLGEPTAVEGAYVSWDLKGRSPTPEGLEPTDERLYTKCWESPPPPSYEAALRNAGRLNFDGREMR